MLDVCGYRCSENAVLSDRSEGGVSTDAVLVFQMLSPLIGSLRLRITPMGGGGIVLRVKE